MKKAIAYFGKKPTSVLTADTTGPCLCARRSSFGCVILNRPSASRAGPRQPTRAFFKVALDLHPGSEYASPRLRTAEPSARFDIKKCTAINGDWIRALNADDLTKRIVPFLTDAGVLPDAPTGEQLKVLRSAVPLISERMETLSQAIGMVGFLFAGEPGAEPFAVDPDDAAKLLDEWIRLLAPGGILHLKTPDLTALAEFILRGTESDETKAYRVYGGQDYAENFHRAGFTVPLLRSLLEARGMEILEARGHEGTNLVITARKRN